MRAVPLLAVSALVLGVSFVSVGRAPAQGVLEATPPVDSSARIGQPRYEDVKLETDTPQPPKAGSAIYLGRGTLEMLLQRKKAGKDALAPRAK